MGLFSVSLLFSTSIEAADKPEPTHELVIYLLSAQDVEDAKAKGDLIGKQREISYLNKYSEVIQESFIKIVEV